MPFRFLWNHPVLLASSAATAGVVLGGYVAVHLFAAPVELASKPTLPKTPAPALASVGAPETTGSGTSEHADKDADHCDQQTWPYLSRDCMERMQNKKRVSRVISTDHVEKPAVEGADTASPPPSGAAVGSQAKGSPPVQIAPPASANVQPTNPVDTTATASLPEPNDVQTRAKAKDTHKTEAKRKSKAEKRKVAKRKAREKEQTEDGDVALATGDSDDRVERRRDRGESGDSDGWADRSSEESDRSAERRRARDDSDDRAERRRDRQQYGERRRVRAARSGDRWGAEREYDVPASDGDGRRRVIVIQRGGGPFGGGLFGGGLFGDD